MIFFSFSSSSIPVKQVSLLLLSRRRLFVVLLLPTDHDLFERLDRYQKRIGDLEGRERSESSTKRDTHNKDITEINGNEIKLFCAYLPDQNHVLFRFHSDDLI